MCKSILFAQMLTNATKVIRWHFTVQPKNFTIFQVLGQSPGLNKFTLHIYAMALLQQGVITQRVKGWPTR